MLGNKLNIIINVVKIVGDKSINIDILCVFLGNCLGLYCLKNICIINLIEYINVKILFIILMIGNR